MSKQLQGIRNQNCFRIFSLF